MMFCYLFYWFCYAWLLKLAKLRLIVGCEVVCYRSGFLCNIIWFDSGFFAFVIENEYVIVGIVFVSIVEVFLSLIVCLWVRSGLSIVSEDEWV